LIHIGSIQIHIGLIHAGLIHAVLIHRGWKSISQCSKRHDAMVYCFFSSNHAFACEVVLNPAAIAVIDAQELERSEWPTDISKPVAVAD
jgi:hypothetical protein